MTSLQASWNSDDGCQLDTAQGTRASPCFTTPPRHEAVRRPSSVPQSLPASLSSHDSAPRTAPDRATVRNKHLRNGATWRVPTTLPADAALRRLGPGRNRNVGRSQKTGLKSPQGQGATEAGRPATPIPASAMSNPVSPHSGERTPNVSSVGQITGI